MEKKGIFDPQVTEEQVVRVSFNDKGIVETIQRVDADRIEVPRVRRKTPTSGNDITVLEQVLGNVGRFNKNAGNATDTAGVNR